MFGFNYSISAGSGAESPALGSDRSREGKYGFADYRVCIRDAQAAKRAVQAGADWIVT